MDAADEPQGALAQRHEGREQGVQRDVDQRERAGAHVQDREDDRGGDDRDPARQLQATDLEHVPAGDGFLGRGLQQEHDGQGQQQRQGLGAEVGVLGYARLVLAHDRQRQDAGTHHEGPDDNPDRELAQRIAPTEAQRREGAALLEDHPQQQCHQSEPEREELPELVLGVVRLGRPEHRSPDGLAASPTGHDDQHRHDPAQPPARGPLGLLGHLDQGRGSNIHGVCPFRARRTPAPANSRVARSRARPEMAVGGARNGFSPAGWDPSSADQPEARPSP